MEKTYFTMEPQKFGKIKYVLIALLPAIIVAFLMDWDAAAWVFILLSAILVFPRDHMIVVFDNSLVEKHIYTDTKKLFACKIRSEQISHFRRNRLGEIVLVDADSKDLLCIESNMTNRDRFEQWLAAHHIESK